MMNLRALRTLQEIELRNASWDSDFMRNLSIWEEIAMKINSTRGEEHEFWCEVMDLHNDRVG